MKADISFLSPHWSRIVHRLHSLGCVKSTYINSIGSLTEVGRYSRHIPSHSEHKSESVDGSTFWNFLNWYQGWVEKAEAGPAVPIFSFSSTSRRVFHQLSLMEPHHDECLDCLLRLFATAEGEREREPQVKRPRIPASAHTVANILERALNHKEKSLKLDFITEGGLISKALKVENLRVKGRQLLIDFSKKAELALDTAAISHVHRQRIRGVEHTTFYNGSNSPQLSLQICS